VRGAASPGVALAGATTRLAGLVGSPISHSLSPRLHAAAYEALGLDWAYAAFDVTAEDLAAAVHGARALGFVGLSVTSPHKDQAAQLATRRSQTVRRLGAANTLTFEGRQVVADSTDGAGLLGDLRDGLGFEPESRCCAVIGAGGAARAAVLALAQAGAKEVLVVNRTPARAFRAAGLAGRAGRVARPEELDAADLVIQATPVGMSMAPGGEAGYGGPSPPAERGERASPRWPAGVEPSRFGSGQIVVDLVYDPVETPFLAEAGRCGATTRNGLGMLVHQAALQVARWTGAAPPLEVLRRAVGA
jgi:shikimate dehydrogenase